MSALTEAQWREMARTPRGRAVAEEHRAKLQAMRADYVAETRQHLAEYDTELATIAAALDGTSEVRV